MLRLKSTGLPNLWTTAVEYPFGGSNAFKTRAFLVERNNNNNVWMYASSRVKDYLDHIEELGGVRYQLLTHRDEASPHCNVLSAPVFCHELEKDAILDKRSRFDESFATESHTFGDDLVAYHSPGHTDGATCYFWQMNEKGESVLFTGDTLYGTSDTEVGVAIEIHPYGNNRRDMIQTLEHFISLDPTYIVPGLVQGTDTVVYEYNKANLEKIIESVSS